DVVLYRRDGGILVLHRIWKRGRDGFYLVGDNEHQIEGPLRRDQIKGILVGIVRKGRYFSVNNLLYRAASGLWLWLRPLRPKLARIVSICKRKR
ncbi:MAG: S24/S26 family peptidase, partial [Acetatifactor sp.]|nr:S24/S26 family peptidase [Acetatifactor sp.]